QAAAFTTTGFTLDRGVDVDAGTLLRLHHAGDVRSLARVAFVREDWHPTRATRERHATFGAPAPAPVVRAEVVEGTLDVDDGDGRRERHEALGLTPEHPRWVARVLEEESTLVRAGEDPTLP